MSTPEETHVLILADSISSSVNGANSPLKLGSNIFKQGSAELNLKLWVFHFQYCQGSLVEEQKYLTVTLSPLVEK